MSDKMHYRVETRNRQERRIVGRFFPQGAGAVVNASNRGRGFTVARTGVGRFVITFDSSYPDLLHAVFRAAHATLVLHARLVAVTTTSQGVTAVTVQVYDSAVVATAAEMAAAATTWLSFEVALSNTTKPLV